LGLPSFCCSKPRLNYLLMVNSKLPFSLSSSYKNPILVECFPFAGTGNSNTTHTQANPPQLKKPPLRPSILRYTRFYFDDLGLGRKTWWTGLIRLPVRLYSYIASSPHTRLLRHSPPNAFPKEIESTIPESGYCKPNQVFLDFSCLTNINRKHMNIK
jgi:hypothetical protein